MSENWEWIIYRGHDFTGKYQVSDRGRIKSVERIDGNNHLCHELILRQRDSSKAHKYAKSVYKTVTLWDEGEKLDVEVHRLVATAFLPKPEGKNYVNHKDGNGSNNSVENLEWCTAAENVRHSIDLLGNDPRKWKSKAVAQKTVAGDLIRVWDNAWEIQRELGFCQVHISRCCRREKRSGIAYGFRWDFAEGRDFGNDGQTGSSQFSDKAAV